MWDRRCEIQEEAEELKEESSRLGQRNGERGGREQGKKRCGDVDKMLALRVRWRERGKDWEREREVSDSLTRPLALYRGPLWGPVAACLSTQTPNSSEVCGQDGSELQLQGKASFSSERAQTHTHTHAHTHKCTHSHTFTHTLGRTDPLTDARSVLTHLSFRGRKLRNLCCYFWGWMRTDIKQKKCAPCWEKLGKHPRWNRLFCHEGMKSSRVTLKEGLC